MFRVISREQSVSYLTGCYCCQMFQTRWNNGVVLSEPGGWALVEAEDFVFDPGFDLFKNFSYVSIEERDIL